MKLEKRRQSLAIAAGGITGGFLHYYAQVTNGYAAGPVFFAAYGVVTLVWLSGAALLLAKQMREVGLLLVVFGTTTVVTLWSLSALLPPPRAPGPVPLSLRREA